jgi:hypothetical protein
VVRIMGSWVHYAKSLLRGTFLVSARLRLTKDWQDEAAAFNRRSLAVVPWTPASTASSFGPAWPSRWVWLSRCLPREPLAHRPREGRGGPPTPLIESGGGSIATE